MTFIQKRAKSSLPRGDLARGGAVKEKKCDVVN